MSHTIEGYIARSCELRPVAARYPDSVLLQLDSSDLAFLPLTDGLSRQIGSAGYLRTRRLGFPIALIRTDYFGGAGAQFARVIHGKQTPLQCGSINQALQILGVQARTDMDMDEFDVVGLGRFRSNEDWVQSGHPVQ